MVERVALAEEEADSAAARVSAVFRRSAGQRLVAAEAASGPFGDAGGSMLVSFSSCQEGFSVGVEGEVAPYVAELLDGDARALTSRAPDLDDLAKLMWALRARYQVVRNDSAGVAICADGEAAVVLGTWLYGFLRAAGAR